LGEVETLAYAGRQSEASLALAPVVSEDKALGGVRDAYAPAASPWGRGSTR